MPALLDTMHGNWDASLIVLTILSFALQWQNHYLLDVLHVILCSTLAIKIGKHCRVYIVTKYGVDTIILEFTIFQKYSCYSYIIIIVFF